MAKKTKGTRAVDNSPVVLNQREILRSTFDLRQLNWTDKQKAFFELAESKKNQIMFVRGCAGTAKTSLAIYLLLKFLNEKKITDLILVRSIVESSDNKMGFLPGGSQEKLCPYLTPFFDKFEMFISQAVLGSLQKDDRITAYPISFLRDLDWSKKGIVLDEAQNLSRKELLTFMTRIGKWNKTFIIGDPQQADIKNSGFNEAYELFNNQESIDKGIVCFEFDKSDVMRSELCSYISDKFEELKQNSQTAAMKEEWRPRSLI